MKTHLTSFYSWFFEKGDARSAAALRIAYAALFLYILWDLYPTVDLVMGHDGIYGTIDRSAFVPYNPLGLLYYFDSPLEIRVWYWITVAITCLMAAGLFSRIMVILLLYSSLLLYHRSPLITYAADNIFTMCYLWLVFLATDRRWSLDQYLRKKRKAHKSTEIELWPIKVIQLQIALVYLIAGISKLSSPIWLDGSAVYYALNWSHHTWEGARHLTPIKPLMMMLTYYSLFAEASFPFLVFFKKTRWIAIGAVAAMHMGIDVLMNIKFFALAMYCGYLAFIRPDEWEWLAKKFSRLRHLSDEARPSEI